VNGNNTLDEEITRRNAKGNKAFYVNKVLFKSNLMSRKSKLKLYWSVIRPIVAYGCEPWVLKESIIQKLSVFETKILTFRRLTSKNFIYLFDKYRYRIF